MTSEEHTLRLIREHIATLPEATRVQTEAIAVTLRTLVQSALAGELALALVGAELAAASELLC